MSTERGEELGEKGVILSFLGWRLSYPHYGGRWALLLCMTEEMPKGESKGIGQDWVEHPEKGSLPTGPWL